MSLNIILIEVVKHLNTVGVCSLVRVEIKLFIVFIGYY